MFRNTLLFAFLAFLATSSHCQTAKPAELNGARLVGGGIFSAFSPDYGPTELYGGGAFVDLNIRRHLGVEGEARFLRFNETYGEHEDNYSLGLRYRWQFRRYEAYGKFLVGLGLFTFPLNYGHGGYSMLIPGGGLDVRLHRFTIRAIDCEYQRWGNFQQSTLSPVGVSTGIGYRFF